MKGTKLPGTIAMTVLMALVVATAVFAQREIAGAQGGPQGGPGGQMQMGGPGGPGRPGGPMGGPRPEMHYGANALFVLAGGTLYKYDTALREAGNVALGGNAAAAAQPGQPPMGGPRGGAFLVTDDQVLAIAGNTFYRISADDLKVKVEKELPAPQAGPNAQAGPDGGPGGPGGPGMMGAPGGQATLELHGKTLYLLRGPQLLAIDTTNGNVTGTTELPRPEPPAGMGRQPGGGQNAPRGK